MERTTEGVPSCNDNGSLLYVVRARIQRQMPPVRKADYNPTFEIKAFFMLIERCHARHGKRETQNTMSRQERDTIRNKAPRNRGMGYSSNRQPRPSGDDDMVGGK